MSYTPVVLEAVVQTVLQLALVPVFQPALAQEELVVQALGQCRLLQDQTAVPLRLLLGRSEVQEDLPRYLPIVYTALPSVVLAARPEYNLLYSF